MRPLDIAIVGAGVAGLATAALLARDGHRPVVFEKFENAAPVGSGLMIQPTGQTVLACLGKRDEIVENGAKIFRLDGRTTKGRSVLKLDYGWLGGDLFGLGVHRSALFKALFDAATEAGASFQYGKEIVRIDGVETEAPLLVDSNGERQGPFDLVLDGGGMFSTLRTAHLGPGAARVFPYGAVFATVPCEGLAFAAEALRQRFAGSRVMIGALPIGHGGVADRIPKAAFFWSLRNDHYEAWRNGDFDAWKQRVQRYWPETESLMAQLSGPGDFLHAVYADVNAHPRLGPASLLIGDSAHGTSPQLGNGANLALLDALSLATELAGAKTLDQGIRRHLAVRRAHTWLYQYMSFAFTPFFQSDLPGFGWFRDQTFGLSCRLPYVGTDTVRIMAGMKTGLFSRMNLEALKARYHAR